MAEIEAFARAVPGRTVDTVFFGGGTPSLMPPETVAAVIEAIRRSWSLAPDAEITLEANPTSVEAGRFRGYGDAGVNRLSMGVQALDDADLRALGRMHDTAEAVRAFGVARSIFARTSFDLIYARQGQTVAAWRAELARALEMAVDHLSLYQLTIEPGTRFGDLAARGRLRGLPDAEASAEMFFATAEMCDRAGLEGYEISNHARPGAESRHNLVYWRYGDYVGVGPGAHGRLTIDGRRWAIESLRSPEAWLDAAAREGTGDIAPHRGLRAGAGRRNADDGPPPARGRGPRALRDPERRAFAGGPGGGARGARPREAARRSPAGDALRSSGPRCRAQAAPGRLIGPAACPVRAEIVPRWLKTSASKVYGGSFDAHFMHNHMPTHMPARRRSGLNR